MIDTVRSGEKITANGYNQIVDTVNDIVKTTYPNNFRIEYGEGDFPAYPVLFQVVQTKYYKPIQLPEEYETLSVCDTTWMLLGKDLDTLKDNLPGGQDLSGVYIINTKYNEDNEVSLDEKISGPLSANWFGISGEYYTGWVNLGLSSWNEIYGAQYNVISSASAEISGELSTWATSYPVYVIGNGKYNGSFLSHWIEEEDLKFQMSSCVCIATKTTPGVMHGEEETSETPKYQNTIQMHVGIIAGGGGGGGDRTPPGCFEPDFENDTWLNPYYFAGGKLGSYTDLSCTPSNSKGKTVILWKEYNLCKVMTIDAISNLSNEVWQNASIALLFSLDMDGNITCDYRKMPAFDIWGAY